MINVKSVAEVKKLFSKLAKTYGGEEWASSLIENMWVHKTNGVVRVEVYHNYKTSIVKQALLRSCIVDRSSDLWKSIDAYYQDNSYERADILYCVYLVMHGYDENYKKWLKRFSAERELYEMSKKFNEYSERKVAEDKKAAEASNIKPLKLDISKVQKIVMDAEKIGKLKITSSAISHYKKGAIIAGVTEMYNNKARYSYSATKVLDPVLKYVLEHYYDNEIADYF